MISEALLSGWSHCCDNTGPEDPLVFLSKLSQLGLNESGSWAKICQHKLAVQIGARLCPPPGRPPPGCS